MHNAGPPPAPTGLTATEIGLGSISLSWTLGFIEGVPVDFTLTVMNLNASNAEPIVTSGVRDQHYIFTTKNSSSCDVYSYQVAARTDAGGSGPSEVITSSIPSLPDIALIGSSLRHSLAKTGFEGISLNVSFNVNLSKH